VPKSPRPLFVVMGAVLAVLVAVLAAACGGGGGEDVSTVIEKTFSSKQKLDSGKLKLDDAGRGRDRSQRGSIAQVPEVRPERKRHG